MKKLLSLAMTVVMLLTMAACGGSGSSSQESVSAGTSTAAPAGAVEYKDTLVVGTYGDQDTLDPQVNVTNDKVLRLLYDGLLTHAQDGSITNSLAESWEHSDDYLTWTFKLKQGVKFASGKELTSADVDVYKRQL